jgi:hypothetical protein
MNFKNKLPENRRRDFRRYKENTKRKLEETWKMCADFKGNSS